jgi:uncharacterized membrane protein YjdF
MKIFNLVFTILFIIFAALQYNDPDPYVWIPIYLVSAYVQTYRNKFDKFSHWVVVTFSLIYAAKLLVNTDGVLSWYNQHDAENLVQSMKATKPWIEQTREFGGLIIILIVASINLITNKKAAAQ